jgi:hypothetical protein
MNNLPPKGGVPINLNKAVNHGWAQINTDFAQMFLHRTLRR